MNNYYLKKFRNLANRNVSLVIVGLWTDFKTPCGYIRAEKLPNFQTEFCFSPINHKWVWRDCGLEKSKDIVPLPELYYLYIEAKRSYIHILLLNERVERLMKSLNDTANKLAIMEHVV